MDWHINLKKLRSSKKLTQEELGFRSNICHSTINRLESGKVKFNEEHLLKLAHCLNMPVNHLVRHLSSGITELSFTEIEKRQAAYFIQLKDCLLDYKTTSNNLSQLNEKLQEQINKEKSWALGEVQRIINTHNDSISKESPSNSPK